MGLNMCCYISATCSADGWGMAKGSLCTFWILGVCTYLVCAGAKRVAGGGCNCKAKGRREAECWNLEVEQAPLASNKHVGCSVVSRVTCDSLNGCGRDTTCRRGGRGYREPTRNLVRNNALSAADPRKTLPTTGEDLGARMDMWTLSRRQRGQMLSNGVPSHMGENGTACRIRSSDVEHPCKRCSRSATRPVDCSE